MPPTHYLGLCAIAKDETPFLREWVAYHYHLGFEKIYIYDNDSAVPVREAVGDFYDLGVFDSYTLQGAGMQLVAYNHCLKNHGHEFEWLAFFDLDEFLCLKEDLDARVFIRDYEVYSALSLNWDMFGSSGFLGRPQGLVTENYRESFGYSINTKCIVRPAKVEMPFTAHHFIYAEGFAVNTEGNPSCGAYAPIAVSKACLNHYSYRSQQDYEDKLRKGDATYAEFNPRIADFFYQQAAQKVETRDVILPRAREVRQMLEEGPLRMRQDITLTATVGLPLSQVVALIGKFLKVQELAMAETLYALCYARFRRDVAFLRMGVTLCRQCGKLQRALTLAEECRAISPDGESYFDVMECQMALDRQEDVEELAVFLMAFAKITDDASLQQRIQAYAGRHRLVLQ